MHIPENTLYTTFILLVITTGALKSLNAEVYQLPPADDGNNTEQIYHVDIDNREFNHVIRIDQGIGEKAMTIGIVYAVQWSYYLTFQWNTIKQHGSFENWYSNMYQPHFDHDSYDYNLIYHTITGTYYYLFFRSRGHTKAGALMWSTISHLFFEFTIETITEPPSFQDMYQTPILGAVVGIGLEYMSNQLLNTEYTAAHIMGYLLNPFALLPFSSYEAASIPIVSTAYYGYALTFRF